MVFNETCLNNYDNEQHTRFKASDQSFDDNLLYALSESPPRLSAVLAVCTILKTPLEITIPSVVQSG